MGSGRWEVGGRCVGVGCCGMIFISTLGGGGQLWREGPSGRRAGCPYRTGNTNQTKQSNQTKPNQTNPEQTRPTKPNQPNQAQTKPNRSSEHGLSEWTQDRLEFGPRQLYRMWAALPYPTLPYPTQPNPTLPNLTLRFQGPCRDWTWDWRRIDRCRVAGVGRVGLTG